MLQESLTNVFRHAEASRAAVALTAADGGLLLEVTDDGRGIGHEAHAASGGIRFMRERALIIGAHLDVTPGPGRTGTRVSLVIGRTEAAPDRGLPVGERPAPGLANGSRREGVLPCSPRRPVRPRD